jgi:hypothetical protein
MIVTKKPNLSIKFNGGLNKKWRPPFYGEWFLLPVERIRNFTNAQWDEASDWAEESEDEWDGQWTKNLIDLDRTGAPLASKFALEGFALL